MRSLQVQIRSAFIDTVLSLASEQGAESLTAVRAERVHRGGSEDPQSWSLVFLTLPNDRIGRFIDLVRGEIDDAEFILMPVGALPLNTPMDRLDEQVRDVSRLSTLELVVASLQSIGAWRGMLLFSVLAGIIAVYGLIFDVAYLLVAAMLINPMGAPAQVAVIGLVIGDARMFGRGGLRFLVSLLVQAATATAIGFAYGLSVSTAMMDQVASLSNWAVLVALAAGAAGAQTQVKSDRDSLVSGTAAGFMVAAALAPPAAVLGLAIPLGRWDYVGLMGFLLTLQFLAIAAGGAGVLYLFGIRPDQASVGRGATRRRGVLALGVVATAAGLVLWQVGREPRFQKADLSRTALEIARDAVEQVPGAFLIDSSSRFTRNDRDRNNREGLLFEITVEGDSGSPAADLLESQIREGVGHLVTERMVGVIPFVRVNVVPGP